ncbi:MAG: hypothetical protein ACHQNT_06565 [Bacteroidia bacterium]
MLDTSKIIPIKIGKNLKHRHIISGLRRKTINEFELVFFENGREKMVLAKGSAAFMKWTKSQLCKARPYIHGLLMLRHRGALKFEAITDKRNRNIRSDIARQLPAIKQQS